ncbi:MAG: alpha/beta hydrolase [Gemmatimonadales bacterium]|nr:MAG: alpha/beta hydrolase [Gemmatimonadales bacterium]
MSAPLTHPFHIHRSGSGEPPLVLVHGFGASGRFWRHWVPELGRRGEVHAVDLKGFGRAPTPPGADYSPLSQARHLAEYIRGLDGSPPVLFGHSLGAGVVVAATLRLLDEGGAHLPCALVLVSGAVYPQRLPPFLRMAQLPGIGDLFLVATPPRPALRLGIQGIIHRSRSVTPEQVEVYREPLTSFRRRRAILRAARQVAAADAGPVASRLAEIQVPTLLLWGKDDGVVPPELGRRMSEDLPDACLVEMPRVGHLPPEEAPEESLAPVLRFLDERVGS